MPRLGCPAASIRPTACSVECSKKPGRSAVFTASVTTRTPIPLMASAARLRFPARVSRQASRVNSSMEGHPANTLTFMGRSASAYRKVSSRYALNVSSAPGMAAAPGSPWSSAPTL